MKVALEMQCSDSSANLADYKGTAVLGVCGICHVEVRSIHQLDDPGDVVKITVEAETGFRCVMQIPQRQIIELLTGVHATVEFNGLKPVQLFPY